jgi:transcriptional regulator with XRE-family HTH domain
MSVYNMALELIEPREVFASRLAGRLRLHGKTQADLSIMSGISAAQISRYMHGRAQPSMETMLRLEAAADKLIYGS